LEEIKDYIRLFNDIVGPQRLIESPTVGNNIVKLHCTLHFPTDQLPTHGSAMNSCGSALESHLKTFIKQPAARTRKTHTEFASDLVNRWSEYQMIDMAYAKLGLQNDMPSPMDVAATTTKTSKQRVLPFKSVFKFVRQDPPTLWYTRHLQRVFPGLVDPGSKTIAFEPVLQHALTKFLLFIMTQMHHNYCDVTLIFVARHGMIG